MRAFGRLDAAILNAGVGLPDPSFRDAVAAGAGNHHPSLAPGHWRKMLDINLGAVVEGAWLAVRHMRGHGNGGTILINASAAGLFPGPGLEAYAASKAGAVQLARSLGWMYRQAGIRVVAVCPQFTHTPLVSVRQPSTRSPPSACRPPVMLTDGSGGAPEVGRRRAWARSWMSSCVSGGCRVC
jgi:NAD(P)-dependent dehydrogenase (short-subunit alcohol dehydrogenase family)